MKVCKKVHKYKHAQILHYFPLISRRHRIIHTQTWAVITLSTPAGLVVLIRQLEHLRCGRTTVSGCLIFFARLVIIDLLYKRLGISGHFLRRLRKRVCRE